MTDVNMNIVCKRDFMILLGGLEQQMRKSPLRVRTPQYSKNIPNNTLSIVEDHLKLKYLNMYD